MKLRRVTTGYVIQTWDTSLGKFVSQEFISEDSGPVWETEDGEPAARPSVPKNRELDTDMIQPET